MGKDLDLSRVIPQSPPPPVLGAAREDLDSPVAHPGELSLELHATSESSVLLTEV